MSENTVSLPSPGFSTTRVSRFQQLLNERDAAAYQVVGTAQNLAAFGERYSPADTVATLRKVLAKYEAAELAINAYYAADRKSR